jgi:hypothetical protein
MNDLEQLTAKIVISGTLVYHDKDGQEVGRADFTMPIEEQLTEGQDDGNQRSK